MDRTTEAAFDVWLAARARTSERDTADCDTVLLRLRETLTELSRSHLLREAPQATKLFRELALCEDMEALNAGLDALAVRIGHLSSRAAPGGTAAPRPARRLLRL